MAGDLEHSKQKLNTTAEEIVSVDTATQAASMLRDAELRFNGVIDSLAKLLPVDTLYLISEGVDHHLKSNWLESLVKSLGDPNKVHYAIHSELEPAAVRVIEEVRSVWGAIFDIESRKISFGGGALLTLRPKGGREATSSDMRLAVPADIDIGRRVYILNGDHGVHEEFTITDVRDKNADYKGFIADDGRRYGLNDTVFILNIDDNKL